MVFKNFLLFIAISILSIGSCFSQDKGYIGVILGPSIPIGDFASVNPDNESAGFAETGTLFELSFGYKIGENFGIAALIRGQSNSIDVQAMADDLSKAESSLKGTIKSEPWSAAAFMIGGYGSFPISEKFHFESKIMIGSLFGDSPEINISLTEPINNAWIKQEEADASAFAFLVGVGFKYDVGNRVCLLANLDYLGAKPEFSNVETSASFTATETNTFSQSFNTINFGIGIGFRL